MLERLTTERRHRRHTQLILGSVAAIAGVTLVCLLLHSQSHSRREQLLASGQTRATPGRLMGESVFRPWHPSTATESLDPETKRALKVDRADTEPPLALDQAVIDLVDRRTTRAIAGLELEARVGASAPEALADLSAAYLQRFEKEGDMLDVLRAVEATDRGLALDPANPTIRFNRATALSLLGTRALALAEWRQVAMEERGRWRDEAVARIRELEQPSNDIQWAVVLPHIESSSTPIAEIESLALRWPAQARAYGEEVLLPRFAAAAQRGDAAGAEHALRIASVIGAALRRSRGEELLFDAVSSIRRTMAFGTLAQRESLLNGLGKFGVGVQQYNEQNLAAASEALASCAGLLAAVDNPLRFWSRFYVAIGEYLVDADRGLVILDALLREIPRAHYPALVGRIEWIAGTIDKVQGRIQSSVRRYELAAANLRRAGGEPAAAFVSVLLAESYTGLGEHSMAWQNRRVAFREVPFSEAPRRNIAMWTEAMEALLHQGNLRLAGPLVEEAAACAEKWGQPLGRASAYLDRAGYRLEVGERAGALADLGRAKTAIVQMEQSALRNQMTYLALITEGLCYRLTEPKRAAALLKRGMDSQQATGNRFDTITYTTELATAQVASGDVAGGVASLERVLDIFENIRATVEDPVSRMQAFHQAQPAFDELLALRATTLVSDPETTFRLAERSRARALLDERERNRSKSPGSVPFARLTELEKSLPDRTALVSYVVLDDRILAWVIEEGTARQLSLPTPRIELEKAIERFRLEMQRTGSEFAIRTAAAPLYDLLIRPLGLLNGEDRSLIIVPDRWLARLPFAALVDRVSGKYLIEQRAVAITPSATILLLGSENRSRHRDSNLSALVIGVSRSGEYRGRILPSLLYAQSEASRVAALYPGASLLRGSDANRTNFLHRSVSSDVVHFAGHAVVDLESPRRSVLLFADETSEALVPLSLGELFDAGLGTSRLVVLSACRSQDSLADDREGLLGLAGAFVSGGVSEVVASPLDIYDDAVVPVMVSFHRHYRITSSASAAFRAAILELLHSGTPGPRSPAAWGKFSVIEGSLGNGGK
jgi:CHAT domain-containing protein